MLATILQANSAPAGSSSGFAECHRERGHIIEKMGVGKRCKLVGKSFFDDVPAGGMLYSIGDYS